MFTRHMRNKYFQLAILLLSICSCKKQEKVDLSKLNLNDPIEALVGYQDKKSIGTDNVEYPYALLLEAQDTTRFTFEGIELNGEVIFQIPAKIENDSTAGGGHYESQNYNSKEQLDKILKHYHAENKIYGYRIPIRSDQIKNDLKNVLIKKYGPGTKNPNTDHGLYWNIKKDHKYIFFAPDYDRLIVLNNSGLSKTCYWDLMNGVIDFGNCNKEQYVQELTGKK
jgi:hypothetical protein